MKIPNIFKHMKPAPQDTISFYDKEVSTICHVLSERFGIEVGYVSNDTWISDFSLEEEDLLILSQELQISIDPNDTLLKIARLLHTKVAIA